MRVDVVRVFTRDGAGGNHLGIVEGHLDDDRMQSIAAEIGFSETVFLADTTEGVATRIFTPARELPFAGHPLVGAGWWLREQSRPAVAFLTGVGPVGVAYEGDVVVIEAPLGQLVTPSRPPAGLEDAVDVAVVAMPAPYEIVELPSVSALEALEPTRGWEHVYCWTRIDDATVRSRFFAVEFGIAEDPATGSAAVALAARLRSAGEPSGRLAILQGEEMGHPCRIELSWSGDIARVGGTSAGESPLEIG